VSSAVPTLLDLTTSLRSHTLEVVIEPSRFEGDTISSEPSLGRTYFARGLQFYKVFMLQSDLSVHETIVYNAPSANSQPEHESVRNITWTRITRPRGSRDTRSRKHIRVADGDEMHDFIVPEGIEVMNKPISKFGSPATGSEEEQNTSTASRVVDHRLVYDALARKDDDSETTATTIDVQTAITKLRQIILGSVDSPSSPLGTM
jgi:RNA polymerase I-specific transcription initiation factor RRN6